MPTLRDMINTARGLSVDVKPVKQELKKGDQAILRRPVGFSNKTKEVIVGQILSFADKGKTTTLSIPRPGGVSVRATVPTNQLEPVSKQFKHNSVNWNPAFRSQM